MSKAEIARREYRRAYYLRTKGKAKTEEVTTKKRGRGRPPGSKNKKKRSRRGSTRTTSKVDDSHLHIFKDGDSTKYELVQNQLKKDDLLRQLKDINLQLLQKKSLLRRTPNYDGREGVTKEVFKSHETVARLLAIKRAVQVKLSALNLKLEAHLQDNTSDHNLFKDINNDDKFLGFTDVFETKEDMWW